MSGIVVAAYSDIGYRCTKWLLDAGEEIKLVYTHPDKPEEQRWWASVADLAKERGVPVALVENLDDPAEETRIRAAAPDFFLSSTSGRWFRADPFDPDPGRAQHARLAVAAFPRPLAHHWAILKGATETGASLHYMTRSRTPATSWTRSACRSARMTTRSPWRAAWVTRP